MILFDISPGIILCSLLQTITQMDKVASSCLSLQTRDFRSGVILSALKTLGRTFNISPAVHG